MEDINMEINKININNKVKIKENLLFKINNNNNKDNKNLLCKNPRLVCHQEDSE